jgi:hypothetical protein
MNSFFCVCLVCGGRVGSGMSGLAVVLGLQTGDGNRLGMPSVPAEVCPEHRMVPSRLECSGEGGRVIRLFCGVMNVIQVAGSSDWFDQMSLDIVSE